MADSRGTEVVNRLERLKSERSVFDSHYQEIAERIWPDRALFTRKNVEQGQKRTERMFDATGALALTRFSAAMESMLTPRTAKWHKLRVSDDRVNDSAAVQRYLDEVTNLLFRVRYSSRANFASQMHEDYMSIGAFGTGIMLIEEILGIGIRYKSCDLACTYIAENMHGIVDTVFREFEYTARQAMQHFDTAKLPEKLTTAAKNNPDQKFSFVHAVYPNEDKMHGRRDAKGMPFTSCYVLCETKDVIHEGGYRSFPYSVGRYITAPGEVNGRSPAMLVLPDLKMLNEMKKTIIRSAHRQVDPPLLLQEDGALRAFDLRPGALNYGGVDEKGQQLVHALQTGGKVELGVDLLTMQQKVINDAFLVTLFQILVEQPTMTATEAMLRAQEKGALLAPTMGRQQSEKLGPMIERELDILGHAGILPEMPPELREMGGEIDIEYVSPLNRAQRSEDGVAIMRTFEQVAQIAQIDPRVMKSHDWLQAAKELGEINGMPSKLARSKDELAELENQEAQAAQVQQLLQAAPLAADTAKTLAETQQIASQGAPAFMPA